ncbi:MAG: catechol 2,3-dioxygenase [Solirubrobacteraceae bacterium]|jgi:catechol 2,3-dioxygenase|nr:catechol 2,3-dioxygenase [Solirubrobacteraceae bacterium]
MSADASPSTPAATLPAATTVGTVRLTVSDLARSQAFYERVLGLESTPLDDGGVALYAQDRRQAGADPVVALHGDPSAPALSRRATGLFHLALLFPDRRALAFALARVAQNRWPLDGASDHLVSEALYLSDPDGNGIELYRDRPRDEWRYRDGQLQMATLPLDLDDVLGELRATVALQERAPSATRMGHVHLQVSELRETEAFYAGILGFDVVVRGYPGALFVSAGGYHHHLGLNTWNSAGASPPAPGSVGLHSYDVILPDEASLQTVVGRVRAAGIAVQAQPEGMLVRDPSGNAVVLRSA